jgi:hypothetical protein
MGGLLHYMGGVLQQCSRHTDAGPAEHGPERTGRGLASTHPGDEPPRVPSPPRSMPGRAREVWIARREGRGGKIGIASLHEWPTKKMLDAGCRMPDGHWRS